MINHKCFYCDKPSDATYLIPGQTGICGTCNQLEIAANHSFNHLVSLNDNLFFVSRGSLSPLPRKNWPQNWNLLRLGVMRAHNLVERL